MFGQVSNVSVTISGDYSLTDKKYQLGAQALIHVGDKVRVFDVGMIANTSPTGRDAAVAMQIKLAKHVKAAMTASASEGLKINGEVTW